MTAAPLGGKFRGALRGGPSEDPRRPSLPSVTALLRVPFQSQWFHSFVWWFLECSVSESGGLVWKDSLYILATHEVSAILCKESVNRGGHIPLWPVAGRPRRPTRQGEGLQSVSVMDKSQTRARVHHTCPRRETLLKHEKLLMKVGLLIRVMYSAQGLAQSKRPVTGSWCHVTRLLQKEVHCVQANAF